MATRSEIVAEAKSWLNTPWHHQGRFKGVGVDCIGLVIMVGVDLGLLDATLMEIEELHNYGRFPQAVRLIKYLDENFDRIPKTQGRPGDVGVFQFSPAGEKHMGILSEYGIIHALNSPSVMKVVEHRIDDRWRGYMVRVYGFRGVTNEAVQVNPSDAPCGAANG